MYPIVYAFFYLLSLLPLRVLLAIGDVLTFFIRDVFGYRRKTVINNIRLAFPEKSEAEVKKIAHDFYRNFTDNWMETIKLLTISEKEFNRRYQCDYSIIKELHGSGRSITLLAGHIFNWELVNAHFAFNQPYTLLCVYMPISSKIIDRLFTRLRSRFGSELVRATHMRQDMIQWRGKQVVLGLVADQSPGKPQKSEWLEFLHQPSAMVAGPERSAKSSNSAVVYLQVSKVKRGHYRCDPVLIVADPKSEPAGEITRKYVRILEANIRKEPALYLWSHNRWKAKWKPEYADKWIGTSPVPV